MSCHGKSHMTTEYISGDMADRLASIDNRLTQGLELLQSLVSASAGLHLVNDALNAYKDQCFKEADAQKTIQDTWIRKISADNELTFPHRKILEFLLNQYDYQTQQFKEVHYSKLVRDARLGKNKAKAYLDFLTAKNYIEKRNDGYRVLYKLCNQPR